MCVYPNSSTSLAHCVPFPDPGPPTGKSYRVRQYSLLTDDKGNFGVAKHLLDIDLLRFRFALHSQSISLSI